MYFDNFIDNAFRAISHTHSFNESVTQKLLPLKKLPSPNGIENFALPIISVTYTGKIGGADSGFVSKRLSFLDLVLIRVAGVIFTYDTAVLKKAEYYPMAVTLPEPVLLKNALEKDEEQQSISLERLRKEVGASIEMINKYQPNYFFIDGSIVPQYQDKPRSDSKISNDYHTIVTLFEKLYNIAQKNNCTLISTIEDLRGVRFKQLMEEYLDKNPIIKKDDLKNSTDSSLLDYFLLKGERTFCFPYTQNIDSHAILRDIDSKWSKNILVFYIKASDFDRPLRVEFIASENRKESADKIASIVFALSSLHKEYSYPSVLIEADLRARLNEEDISVVYDKLVDKIGPKIKMRRNSRPFN